VNPVEFNSGYWEKSLQGLSLTINGAKLCFATTHQNRGKTLTDGVREGEFAAYSDVLNDLHCHAVFWGGDFNLHSAEGWISKDVHPQHIAPLPEDHVVRPVDDDEQVEDEQEEVGHKGNVLADLLSDLPNVGQEDDEDVENEEDENEKDQLELLDIHLKVPKGKKIEDDEEGEEEEEAVLERHDAFRVVPKLVRQNGMRIPPKLVRQNAIKKFDRYEREEDEVQRGGGQEEYEEENLQSLNAYLMPYRALLEARPAALLFVDVLSHADDRSTIYPRGNRPFVKCDEYIRKADTCPEAPKAGLFFEGPKHYVVANGKRSDIMKIFPTFAPTKEGAGSLEFKTTRPVGVADYIFMSQSPSVPVVCTSYGTVIGPVGSDHYPVKATYVITVRD
jgi:hypothetical protein